MDRLRRKGTDPAAELRQLVRRLEGRYPSTHGHSRRVAGHAGALAVELGLAEGMVTKIRTAALLHDVGKTEVPAEIVDKPGPLSDEEYATIRDHAEIGARMVEALGDATVTAIVRHHHERFDGAGYPAGLRDYEIPLGARIVAVADTYDALISQRPYRPPMSERRALGLLEEAAGGQLDPTVVAVALRLAVPRRRRRRLGRFAKPSGSEPAAAPAPAARPLRG